MAVAPTAGKVKAPKVRSSSRDIGIVVIGRNEGDRLTRCLQSLQLENLVMVYVDSGSTDGSQDNARKFGANVVALDMSQPFTAARARNTGSVTLKRLQPHIQFIQFLDGDCSLVADWLSSAHKFLLEQPSVAAVFGRRRELNPEASVYNWLCDAEWATPIGEAQSCGGDVLFRVAPFEASGGYRESLVAGEEPELCIRLRATGWKIWRIDVEMTRHDAAITRFTQWWRRCKRGGYGMIQVASLHSQSKHGMWMRESTRALVYGGIVPALLIAGIFYPILMLAILVYPLQIVRTAMHRGGNNPESWKFALMLTIAKFAEFNGMINFLFDTIRRKRRLIIEYK